MGKTKITLSDQFDAVYSSNRSINEINNQIKKADEESKKIKSWDNIEITYENAKKD